MKRIIKAILILIITLLVLSLSYILYVVLTFHRVEDNLSLDITGTAKVQQLQANKQYRISSANLGFGAYSDDYSFFMDGGTQSWAYSKDAVNTNINGSLENVLSLNPDILLFQEIDLDSTRSYHINEIDLLKAGLTDAGYDKTNETFALNYNSPFLIYPFNQPHGASKAGLYTVSTAKITASTRYALPIQEGISKYLELDRCYSKNIIPTENGKHLALYNVHLSAYTTDPAVSENQIKQLNADMMAEYEAGNYVIAGGDMNKDLLGDSSKYFGVKSNASWAQPFKTELLSNELTLIGPIDEANPVPSCRNADEPYSDSTFVLTVDGFIVSPNVDVIDSNVLDTGFKYSDHNPVYMDFKLK